MIDLHIHSTVSDGNHSPAELVALGVESGVTAMALTDHDTLAGQDEFIEAARLAKMQVVTGVEISAQSSRGTMHLLGYGMDHTNPALLERLAWMCEGRDGRNDKIVQKLQSVGCNITIDDVLRHAGEGVVGRPHIAQAMIEIGFVRNKREAFDRFLARGKRAYVHRPRLQPKEAIKLLHDAGGVAVLAHPITLKRNMNATEKLLKELVDFGLGGLEVTYPEHDRNQRKCYSQMAARLGLIKTGGTDFHGTGDLRIGHGFGNLQVDDTFFTILLERIGELRSKGLKFAEQCC